MGVILHTTLEGFLIFMFHTGVKCILELFGGGIIETVALSVVSNELFVKDDLPFT